MLNLSSELCIAKMYTTLLQVNYPEQYLLVQSGLYQKGSDMRYQFYYNYFKNNYYGFGRPISDVCCECLLFDIQIKVEKQSYKKQLETKTTPPQTER